MIVSTPDSGTGLTPRLDCYFAPYQPTELRPAAAFKEEALPEVQKGASERSPRKSPQRDQVERAKGWFLGAA